MSFSLGIARAVFRNLKQFNCVPAFRSTSTGNQQATKQLHPIHQQYLRQVLSENEERVAERMVKHKKNLTTFIVVVSLIVSIYGYTIYAVKQETFLDDFEPPEK